MILQTGLRTDIPAFYSTWFINRLRAGFVLVRNPYNPQAVTRYEINPEFDRAQPAGDVIHQAKQGSWRDDQISILDLL